MHGYRFKTATLTLFSAGLLMLLLAAAGCSDDTTTAPNASVDQLTDEELLDSYAKMGVEEFTQERTDRWARLSDLLGLSEEQVTQLQAAFTELHDGLQELRELYRAGELTREELREQVAILEDAFEAALQDILDEDQLALLEELRERHRQNHHGQPCFRLVLPVTFVMPDGSTIEVADREDRAEIRAWYEANPDVTERPALQYPVEIEYRDGAVETIEDAEAMAQAREDCHDENDGGGHHGGGDDDGGGHHGGPND